ncbi:MAG: hypothetical protein HY265_08135 [Deltaproteobacteria bacterium]|nr:hypothetical protein [Deltaproteobacteria bacterium]
MNEFDVIESLKQKEEELDNLLNEAREKAAHIKKDAFRRAEEMRLAMSKELDAMLKEYKKLEMVKIDKEAETIKQDALKKAQDLNKLAEEREAKAVEMAVRYVIEGYK